MASVEEALREIARGVRKLSQSIEYAKTFLRSSADYQIRHEGAKYS